MADAQLARAVTSIHAAVGEWYRYRDEIRTQVETHRGTAVPPTTDSAYARVLEVASDLARLGQRAEAIRERLAENYLMESLCA